MFIIVPKVTGLFNVVTVVSKVTEVFNVVSQVAGCLL